MVITSEAAAYLSAHVYRCVTVAGAFPVCTHRTQLEGGGGDLMDVRLIILTLTVQSTKNISVALFKLCTQELFVEAFCVSCSVMNSL